MALIDHIDGVNRDIYLSAATVGASIHPIDIYKEVRTLRRTNESLRYFLPFLQAKGYEAKGGGKFTERYVICLGGTRIIPYNVSHTLTVTGTIITDDGQEGIACFDRSPLSTTTRIDINYVPPQVEVITVASGDGVLAAEQLALLQATLAAATASNIQATKARKMQTNKAIISSDGLSVSIYEDDGATLLHTFSISQDKNTRTPV